MLAECNVCGMSTVTLIATKSSSSNLLDHFLATDDYTCLLHEATPTNYALICKAYTVWIHVPRVPEIVLPVHIIFRHCDIDVLNGNMQLQHLIFYRKSSSAE